MKDRQMTTAMTKAQSKELADLYKSAGIEDRAGEGQEYATQDDYAMPFLSLLQSGSPQCKKTDPRRVEGAEEGMFFNTVEKTVYDSEEGVRFIPCAYRRSFVEWKLREDGGGFCGEFLPGEEPRTVADEKNRDILDNGNELKDTRYWYGFVVNEDGSTDAAVIGMTRTQLKVSKAWFNMKAKNIWPDGVARLKAPPDYVWSYRLKSVPQQKDDHSFWNWDVTRDAPVMDAAVLEACKNLHDSVKAGDIRRADDSIAETEGGNSDSSNSESSY
jgi:hypothetical protein